MGHQRCLLPYQGTHPIVHAFALAPRPPGTPHPGGMGSGGTVLALSSHSESLAADARAASAGTFATGKVILLSMGHLIHDSYPAFLAPLLPLLKDKLDLSNALAGTLATFLRSSSLVQPFIGYLADRTSARWFVVLAPACTAVFMSLLGAAPSYSLLIPLLVCTGLSHASYHAPAPAMIAHVSGDRVGKGMSLFMMGGELGRAAGPLIIVGAVQWFGLEGSYLAAIPGLCASLMMARLLGPIPRPAPREDGMEFRTLLMERRRPLSLILAFAALRGIVAGSIAVFTPAYLMARGMTLVQAAAAFALFEIAGAGGALAGGTLSDRMGRRRTLIVIQILMVPSLYALVDGPEKWLAIFLALAGVLVFSGAPVILALLQEVLPEARSTASGLYFSLNYIATGISAVLFGVLADLLGIHGAFRLLAFAPLLAVPSAVFLPYGPLRKGPKRPTLRTP